MPKDKKQHTEVKHKNKSNTGKNQSSSDAIASMLGADKNLFEENTATSQAQAVQIDESADKPAAEAVSLADYQAQQNKIISLEEALIKAKDALIRAQADSANTLRRSEKAVSDAHKYALEKFAKALLAILDSLEQALQTQLQDGDNDGVKSLKEGVQLTLDMFQAVFEQFSIVAVNPVGARFDPQLHEAMVMQPSDEVEAGMVLEVIQKGYTLNGRLMRPARVIVAKAV